MVGREDSQRLTKLGSANIVRAMVRVNDGSYVRL